jgi:hypothetical protein
MTLDGATRLLACLVPQGVDVRRHVRIEPGPGGLVVLEPRTGYGLELIRQGARMAKRAKKVFDGGTLTE